MNPPFLERVLYYKGRFYQSYNPLAMAISLGKNSPLFKEICYNHHKEAIYSLYFPTFPLKKSIKQTIETPNKSLFPLKKHFKNDRNP